MLKIMVCDDEPFIFEQIRELTLSYCMEKNLEYQITYCATARELLDAPFDYDILFLDIMLDGGIDGISLGKQLREAGNTALFCIITSRKDRAIDGYQVTVFRYLVKPVEPLEFRRTFDALIDTLDYGSNIVSIKFKYQTSYVNVKDIIYVESYLRRHYIVTKKGRYPTTASWAVLTEQFLAFPYFFSPRKSYIVNLAQVVRQSPSGLTMADGTDIKFTDGRYEQFLSAFSNFLNMRG